MFVCPKGEGAYTTKEGIIVRSKKKLKEDENNSKTFNVSTPMNKSSTPENLVIISSVKSMAKQENSNSEVQVIIPDNYKQTSKLECTAKTGEMSINKTFTPFRKRDDRPPLVLKISNLSNDIGSYLQSQELYDKANIGIKQMDREKFYNNMQNSIYNSLKFIFNIVENKEDNTYNIPNLYDDHPGYILLTILQTMSIPNKSIIMHLHPNVDKRKFDNCVVSWLSYLKNRITEKIPIMDDLRFGELKSLLPEELFFIRHGFLSTLETASEHREPFSLNGEIIAINPHLDKSEEAYAEQLAEDLVDNIIREDSALITIDSNLIQEEDDILLEDDDLIPDDAEEYSEYIQEEEAEKRPRKITKKSKEVVEEKDFKPRTKKDRKK